MAKLSTKHVSSRAVAKVDLHEKLSLLDRPIWLTSDPQGRPSELTDNIWFLGDHLPGSDNATGTVNWEYGSQLTLRPERSKYWNNFAKIVAYYCMESDRVAFSRTTTLAIFARELRGLCAWIHVERKRNSVSSVEQSDIDAYEEFVRGRGVSRSHAETKLMAFKYLALFADEVGESILFVPYLQAGSLRKASKRVGVADGHTPTLEPRILFALLDTAVRIVEKGEETIHSLEKYLSIVSGNGHVAFARPSREFYNVTGGSSNDMFDAVRLLYGASLVLILALLGDRKHQISALKLSDVEVLLRDDAQDLPGTVRKSSPSVAGTRTSKSVSKHVKLALSHIVSITRATRDDYDGDMLLVRPPIKNTANTNPQVELGTTRIYRLLDLVAVEADISIGLRPHMFRRSFAMLWTWRFELGDLYWLSRLLHHSDPAYTLRYTEDEDVWKFLPEEQRKYAYEVMERVLIGAVPMKGGVSKSLRRYGRLLHSKVSVLTPKKVHPFVEKLVTRHEYSIVPQADGYCIMSIKRGARAKCSSDGKNPNYSRREDRHCVDCANYGVQTSNRAHWQARLEVHTKVFASTTIPILRNASQESIKRAQKVLGWIDDLDGSDGNEDR